MITRLLKNHLQSNCLWFALVLMIATFISTGCNGGADDSESNSYATPAGSDTRETIAGIASGTYTYDQNQNTVTFNTIDSNFPEGCGPQVGTNQYSVLSLTPTQIVMYSDEDGEIVWARESGVEVGIMGTWFDTDIDAVGVIIQVRSNATFSISGAYLCDIVEESSDEAYEYPSSEGGFVDMGNGTVQDNDTGLIWLKDANAFGTMNWDDAMEAAESLKSGGHGLTDGSENGDWRLPTKEQWEAFVNRYYADPALCNTAGDGQWSERDAFVNVQSAGYWSSNPDSDPYMGYSYSYAWFVDRGDGVMDIPYQNSENIYVWPVRSDS